MGRGICRRLWAPIFKVCPLRAIMVEDTIEPMTAKEYKDKSKEMAIRWST